MSDSLTSVMGSTTTYRQCSDCGSFLIFGEIIVGGKYLCQSCYDKRHVVASPGYIPFQWNPTISYTGEWLKENFRLKDELAAAQKRIAELESIVKAVRKALPEEHNNA